MTNDTPSHRSASAILRELADRHADEPHTTLRAIVSTLGNRSFAILLIVFATPAGLPFPAPWGITQLLSLILIAISVQLALGRHHLWLPGWLERRRLKTRYLTFLADKSGPLLQKIERLIQPRLLWLNSWAMQRLIGVLCILCALSAALPIPLTNTLPSAGIVLMAMAMMERDGLLLLAGMALGLAGLTLSVAVLLLGHEAVLALFG